MALLNLLTAYQKKHLVEFLPYHECDSQSRQAPDLDCLIKLQAQHTQQRHLIFLTGTLIVLVIVIVIIIIGLKKMFNLVPVSNRPCQFLWDPNYFMSLGKKKIKKLKITKKIKTQIQHAGSIHCSPTYHSLPLEK